MNCSSTKLTALAIVIGAAALAASLSGSLNAQGQVSPSYLREQAADGKTVYTTNCASCHGANLDDGPFGPPLSGVQFQQAWGGKPASVLFEHMTTTMPPGAPGTLGEERYTQILAYLLQQNRVAPGTQALPSDLDALKTMIFPAATGGAGGGLSAGIALPPYRIASSPLARITPVSDAMLRSPAEGDWLSWRRTYDAQGFSPLKQITKNNVAGLQVAWAWSLPNGPNEATPLVHDGVLFVHSYGDRVQALDAATGDLLWQYSRRLPKGSAPGVKRAISIYGDRLFVPTSDSHVVALDVRTGTVVWDKAIDDGKPDVRLTGGPLVAKSKVMIGTVGRTPGGNYIVALDTQTGKEVWRFYTIPRPEQRGGESWNGLPLEKRNGGSVWLPGSYDPALNLAFFGPAPTYDTAPLRVRAKGAAEDITNNALFTNATIALNPDNGELVWYFEHLPNDQWDLDWAFERHVLKLPVGGATKSVVVTAGKPGIYDVLEADKGRYVFSMDLGLQNFVTAIDPKTGAKTIDLSKIPGDGETKFVCPHAAGGKGWQPGSYNPDTNVLFVPLVESCMDYTPVAAGERGLLSTGVRLTLRPRPESDGKYGRLEAINLQTRKVAWTQRQRAPRTTGTLATAGGLVFAGSLDRMFAAYDDATGKELWSTRLNDVPNSVPITYAVNGRQYVAMVVGNGGTQAASFAPIVPEIKNPPDRGAEIWVFELRDSK